MLLQKSSFILTRAAQVWSIILFSLLLLISCFVQTTLPMDGTEMAKMVATSPWLLLVAVMTLFFLFCLLRDLPKIKSKWLFIAGCLIYLILGGLLISQVTWVLRDDARLVYESALAINHGDYTYLTKDNYLYRYPHQLGLVTYERVLVTLFRTSSTKLLFFLNLMLVLASNALTWKITDSLFKRPLVNNLVILLSFFFLPQLFFILFVYGLVPGLFFSLLAFYAFILYRKQGKVRQAFLFMVAMLLAYLIRNNYIILTLSFAIVALLDMMARKKYALFVVVALTFMMNFGASAALKSYYEQLADTNLSGEPKIAWVTMGLNDRPIYNRVAGWYDAYVETVYSDNNGNFKKIEQQSRTDLSKRLTYMSSHPKYTFDFFKNKIISTWTDSLFQSVWSGPVEAQGQKVSGDFAKSIYHQKSGYQIAYFIAHILLIFIYFGVLVAAIHFIKRPIIMGLDGLVPLIYLTGGFIFHLFWETKSQYVYPYVFLLLPLSAFGLITFLERLQFKKKSRP